MKINPFVRTILISIVIIEILTIFFALYAPQNWMNKAMYSIPIFVASITYSVYKMLEKADRSYNAFIRVYMAGTFMKLFISLIVIVVYLLIYRKEAISFVAMYSLSYFYFMALEVIFLVNKKATNQ